MLVQADPEYRSDVNDIGEVYVRSMYNQMVPLLSIVTPKFTSGPSVISRFNGFKAAKMIGSAAPGYSSGNAMDAMESGWRRAPV